MEDIREQVPQKYAAVITKIQSCCGDIDTVTTRSYDFTDERAANFLPDLTLDECQALNGALVSAFIRARKPVAPLKADIDYRLRQAMAADLPFIEKLLAENGLPTAGVAEHLSTFFIADTGSVDGVIGMELSGAVAILRSLAVAGERRKQGLGNALVDYALAQSRQSGATAAYLLTNTAASFAARWGFTQIPREDIPAYLLQRSALSYACPATSTCMKLAL